MPASCIKANPPTYTRINKKNPIGTKNSSDATSLNSSAGTLLESGALANKMEEPTEFIAASFPVVFFNGEQEVEIGSVLLHPSLGFKRFKTLISHKLGIPPHQISTSLVRRKKARSFPATTRRVPIDESTDFEAISQERDCYVLAILKRSRRTRTQRRVAEGSVTAEPNQKLAATMLPVKSILRRFPVAGPCVDAPFVDNLPEADRLRIWDYENQLHNLQMQREMYLMTTSAAAYSTASSVTFPETVSVTAATAPSAPSAICEECLEAEEDGRDPDFHQCVYDAVTVGFRSAVGPIQRPSKTEMGSWF